MSETENLKLEEITTAIKSTKDCRMLERYQAVKLYLEGSQVDQIAEIISRCRVTVGSYIRAYLAKGLSGLERKLPPGRQPFLSDTQKQQVKQVVSQRPEEVGFPGELNWTCSLVASWIYCQFQIKYSDRGVLFLLHDLGFSYTHSTYTLVKANDGEKGESLKKN
ncbi:helix-turn-helix domain-containing protein [Propionispora vibrioides]|uniref:Putative transposase n=1 Tax=Propionispora vibrioides TaxID=112903 RepID=A0A1H8VZ08_9FIRM|nr:helix-turn-helix domain-containing protein [Propionispora vibrioides]SEP20503.1 putative transposase [Propionispora vibrioides]